MSDLRRHDAIGVRAASARSLRLHGAVTSIRLEARFWAILDEMADGEGLTTPKFIAKLHDEVLDLHGEVRNFTSLLRVVCAIYLDRVERAPKTVGVTVAAMQAFA